MINLMITVYLCSYLVMEISTKFKVMIKIYSPELQHQNQLCANSLFYLSLYLTCHVLIATHAHTHPPSLRVNYLRMPIPSTVQPHGHHLRHYKQ